MPEIFGVFWKTSQSSFNSKDGTINSISKIQNKNIKTDKPSSLNINPQEKYKNAMNLTAAFPFDVLFFGFVRQIIKIS